MIVRPEKLDALTSLRFFAAAMIVVGHAHELFGSLGLATSMPLEQGVSFFFVLSGFILAYNYPSFENFSEIRRFWLARVARVWPLHAVTCLLFITVIFRFDRDAYFPGAEGLARLLVNLLLLQAWIPLHDWTLAFNGVSWSLSAEFFFYFCFPFFIIVWKRHWHWLVFIQLALVAAFMIAGRMFSLPAEDSYPGLSLPGLIYFNPMVRILEFSAGISVAYGIRRIGAAAGALRTSQWLLIELLAIGVVILSLLAAADLAGLRRSLGTAPTYYFTREGLWPIYALLIGVFALSRGPVVKLLSLKPLVFLGEISFALYLCHAIVIHYLQVNTESMRLAGFGGVMVFWVICLSLSSALYLGVEQPARRAILNYASGKGALGWGASKFHFSPIVATAMCYLLVLASVMLVLPTYRGQPANDLEVNRILSSPGAIAISGGADFGGLYSLLGVRLTVQNGDEKSKLQVVLRASREIRPDEVLAVHLNNVEREIIGNFSSVIPGGAGDSLSAGSLMIEEFFVEKKDLENVASIGIAIYRKGADLRDGTSSLLPVKAGIVDWDGKRLLMPI